MRVILNQMRAGGCLIGGALTTALGVLWRIIKAVCSVIGKGIYYFGLYVPIAYLIYGAVLYFIFDFRLFVPTTDGSLYTAGFCITLICSVIIAYKNIILRPYRKYFAKQDVIEYDTSNAGKNAPEAPKIYKSKVNPDVIVYEYYNRYDLYEEHGDGLKQVATEYKLKKEKRW